MQPISECRTSKGSRCKQAFRDRSGGERKRPLTLHFAFGALFISSLPPTTPLRRTQPRLLIRRCSLPPLTRHIRSHPEPGALPARFAAILLNLPTSHRLATAASPRALIGRFREKQPCASARRGRRFGSSNIAKVGGEGCFLVLAEERCGTVQRDRKLL